MSKSLKAKKFERILVARPEKMKYEEYKKLRKQQDKRLKDRLNGFIVWPSKCLPTKDSDGKEIYLGESHGTLKGALPTIKIK